MKIISEGIIDGKILDKYGKKGNLELSLPFKFLNYPTNTISFALVIEDFDAIPVCGYDYIHWLVANVDTDYLDENASVLNKDYIVQGKNSNNEDCYIGMAPPDKMHTYDITLYALDTRLDLKNGFGYSELLSKMEGHILDKSNIKGTYDN